MRTDCGCGCGGTSSRSSVFVRPRFFAGQLLTEDDLGLLVDYTTGKARLHNRSLSGPGVVCGLEVSCDPCGGGTVVVHPGHALDCAGNDIVLTCREGVDVQALVRELRVGGMGVDCGDGCAEDGLRKYGLFVRYEELPVEPVAPYATEEPCPSPGCVPSRIQEGFRFVVKTDGFDDHRHNPGTKLLASLGDLGRAEQARHLGQRLGQYVDAMSVAAAAVNRTFRFDPADAVRYTESLEWLTTNGTGEDAPAPTVAREMTERVRALASAVARFDTYDAAGQEQLKKDHPELGGIDDARAALRSACTRLGGIDAEATWPDAAHRTIAAAVVSETNLRVAGEQPDADAPLEVRLLAQGTPLSHALQVEFRADLAVIREWLLGRLDSASELADCGLRSTLARIEIPTPLPRPEVDSGEKVTLAQLQMIAKAAGELSVVLRRFVTDAACATLNPPCTDCADTDVLLARLELDDCDVVRICSATREQVLPGGGAYGEWLPKLYRLRELAERVCCQPVASYSAPNLPSDGPVPRPYAEKLLEDWPRTDELEQMLSLLLTRAPGETPPKALHEQVYAVPSEVTDSLQELAVLRSQVTDLTAALEGLRAQLGSAQAQVSEVREQLPERLGSRLEELESAPEPSPPEKPAAEPARAPKPAARRTRSTRAPKSGDSA